MRQLTKINSSIFLLTVLIMWSCLSCRTPDQPRAQTTQTEDEIQQIDTLLRDPVFAKYMARSLDSAYRAAVGEAQPVFLKAGDDTALQLMKLKDEKVATSIAGFYALECGIGLLSKKNNEPFVTWLEKIADGKAGNDAVLLLNRFANATWKAGQPFRDMERLQRYNFRVAALLSKEEVDKDSIQIVKAAKKLLPVMAPLAARTNEEQMRFLRLLMHDTSFAVRMALYADSAFAASQNKKAQTSTVVPDDTSMVKKTVRQVKIATSIAGFYALECGLNYLVTTKHGLPSSILRSLVNDSLPPDDQLLFARFANATWKAGQPFRGLNRITRETFTPFYFLSKSDIDKDLVQVKAAGRILLSRLETASR